MVVNMVIMDINWQKNNSFILSSSNQKPWSKARLNSNNKNRFNTLALLALIQLRRMALKKYVLPLFFFVIFLYLGIISLMKYLKMSKAVSIEEIELSVKEYPSGKSIWKENVWKI